MGRIRTNRKKGKVGRTLLVIVGILLVVYVAGIVFFQSHFLIGTKINGVACSMRSVAGAEEAITDVVQNFDIIVKERQKKTEHLNGKSFSMDVVFDDSMNDLVKKQRTLLWPVSFAMPQQKAIGVHVTYDQEGLKQAVLALDCAKENNMEAPVDATISYNSEKKEFEAVPESVGTKVELSKLQEAAENCVKKLNESLNLEKQDCYVNPVYYEKDEAVTDALDLANAYINTKVTYDYGTDQVTVEPDQIASWLKVSGKLKVSFDKEKVAQFVGEMASKYDTIFSTRTFQTSYGYSVTLSKGDYGWWTNRDAETKSLISFIKEKKSGTKEVEYLQKAAARGEDDLGNTYVEVNLTRQHVILYKNGKVVDEADCVTGKLKNPTPSGIYSVTYKDHTYENHQVQLVGENYTSKVDYFIPFNGNIGFHDASWRRVFGGTFYKYKGSHGCVNLPYHMAVSIYNNMEKGYPVIVYEDPNVPSATTEEKAED